MSIGHGRLLTVGGADPDNTTNRLIRDYLTGCGFSVSNVISETCCLAALERAVPDLVLLSLHDTPNDTPHDSAIDFHHLLDQIRMLYASLPIVVLASVSQQADVKSLMDEGANDYFLGSAGESGLLPLVIEKAIANSQLASQLVSISDDRDAGYRIQQQLLPSAPVRLAGIDIDYVLVPSHGMSGDSVNYLQLETGEVLFYLADVAGHGAAGGMVAAALGMIAMNLNREPGLSGTTDTLAWFNQQVMDLGLDRHVTMFLGIVNREKTCLEYSSAAHFPATILYQDGKAQFLELGGLPLGIKATHYESQHVNLHDSFTIVLFSDGVLEILSEQPLADKEAYLLSLVNSGDEVLDQLKDHLGLDDVADVPDDIAILTLSWAGS